ncbi:23S rRNA (adenine(2030)-N(6))-methyltransferase RlmJ [Ramlibacter humi]|uniref:Ribosomal RNA large subunit methyltransferase J n=1 Tax=Ramlibacter humi TaxID=2530451 RepID=A0A4Z0BLX0_9BURK|nr:23S rRNA (adenine(2030)-N(6))-methyltransferase RlmJ [Ramlibacter humi]TFY99094.1 23S rRNA (adenine(2030)-N(6))-methyltransferase RlmJ [Ramlibacter humi]
MFSYRHAFHAGNHADVFKHVALLAILRHLTLKEAPLWVIDTHAGAGLYRLDGDYAGTSGEAIDGVFKLFEKVGANKTMDGQPLAPAVADYIELVQAFNRPGEVRVYPGSPFIAQHALRSGAGSRDKLKLFELHPSDSQALAGNVAQLKAGRQVTVDRQDGFEALKALLPPPSRRALVLIDPSYEIKSDYAKVTAALKDALPRFATGTYAVWYPVIPRAEAHDLPRKLKTLANQARKPWLHATFSVGAKEAEPGGPRKPTLNASGLFVLNPPHTLKPALQAALPQLLSVLGRGRGQGQQLEAGG